MAGSRRGRYPPEYRERMVELVRAGRSPGSLARASACPAHVGREGSHRRLLHRDPPPRHAARGLCRRWTDPPSCRGGITLATELDAPNQAWL